MTQDAVVRSNKMSPNPNRFNTTDFRRNHWLATPEAGTTLEDVKRPDFWAHVSARLKPMDLIDIYPEDGPFFATFLVLSASRVACRVQMLTHIDLSKEDSIQAPEDASELEVLWGGPVAKHRVVRRSDKKVLKDSFNTKAEAEAWRNDHVKSLAA